MASSLSRSERSRDKLHLWLCVLAGIAAFLLVFRPIRLVKADEFQPVSFTYRYEKPFAANDEYRANIVKDVREKLADLKPLDAVINFPTTSDIRIRSSFEKASEADAFNAQVKDILLKVIPKEQGNLTDTQVDTSAFAAPPIAKLGPIGIYKPKLGLRLGLDLQGGVQLVLKARTQNTEYEYNLGNSTAELKAALAKGQPTGATTAPASKSPSAPAAGQAGAPTPAAPTTATGAPASSAPVEPTTTTAPGQPANEAPDGGEPIRLAQAAPATPTAADNSAESKPSAANDDAELVTDESLRRAVAERIRLWAEDPANEWAKRFGEISAEVVGANVVMVRTFIDPRTGGADKANQLENQRTQFLSSLKEIFPSTTSLGEGRSLSIPADALERVKDVIQRRVDRLGVSEAQVLTQGTDRVAVQLPGIKDPDEAVALIGTTARLEFRKVPDKYVPRIEKGEGGREVTKFTLQSTGADVPTEVVYHEAPEFEGQRNILVGTDLKTNALSVSFVRGNEPSVGLELNSAAAERFDKWAGENYHKYLAAYLDREVISAPIMEARRFSGRVSISGGFESLEEAKQLMTLLQAGSLPVPVDIVEQRTVSATLGADAVRQSAIAGLIGLVLIFALMAIMFKVSGWLANIALVFYCLYTLAALYLVGATLTMPGILGFLLSIGMAVDANVIVFERLKEEVREFPTRPAVLSLRHAYDRSWPAILDGNATALMMAIVLYALGTGAIRGFAVTLSLGILCHLFTALFMTRKMQELLAGSRYAEHLDRMYRI